MGKDKNKREVESDSDSGPDDVNKLLVSVGWDFFAW